MLHGENGIMQTHVEKCISTSEKDNPSACIKTGIRRIVCPEV